MTQDVKQLAAELYLLARTRLLVAGDDDAPLNQAKYPHLTAATVGSDEHKIALTGRAADAIRDAIQCIPNLRIAIARKDGGPRLQLRARDAAMAMFFNTSIQIRDELYIIDSYSDILEVLRAEAQRCSPTLDTGTWAKRQLSSLRQQMARQLTGGHMSASEPTAGTGPQPTIGRVPRTDLERQIASLLESGANPVILWGEHGNGKTELARHYLATVGGSGPRIVIRGPQGLRAPYFDQDIIAALRIIDVEVSQDPSVRYADLVLHITEGSFGAVLLDNVDDQIIDLLVQSPACPIIATSRRRLGTRSGSAQIRIGPYTTSEAIAALQGAGADASTEKSTELVEALGCRPEAIHLAGSLVAAGLYDVYEIYAACCESAGEVLDAAPRILELPGEQGIFALYRTALDELSDFERHCLSAIAWLIDNPDSQSVRAWVARPTSSASARIVTDAATRVFDTHGFIDIDRAEMNSLTRHILRYLTTKWLSAGLSKVIAGFPKPSGDPPWPNIELVNMLDLDYNMYGLSLMIATEYWTSVSLFEHLLPGVGFGGVAINDTTWLFRQGAATDLIPSTICELVVVTIHPNTNHIQVWTESGGADLTSRMAPIFLYFAQIVAGLVFWLYDSALGSYGQQSPPRLNLHDFRSDSDRHVNVSQIPEAMAERARLPILAACGTFYIPRGANDGEDAPPALCSACVAATSTRPGKELMPWNQLGLGGKLRWTRNLIESLRGEISLDLDWILPIYYEAAAASADREAAEILSSAVLHYSVAQHRTVEQRRYMAVARATLCRIHIRLGEVADADRVVEDLWNEIQDLEVGSALAEDFALLLSGVRLEWRHAGESYREFRESRRFLTLRQQTTEVVGAIETVDNLIADYWPEGDGN